jgi:thiosulfate/3-mercaptopyruvate sulfurtransferase
VFVGKDKVQAAIGEDLVCTINALAPEAHAGKSPQYGRPGRVPGSVNVQAAALVDPKTQELPTPEKAQVAFDAVGADPSHCMIVYCGGGIAATLDAFLLHQLGYADVAVYDNSMSEWATDESLPIEVD